MILTSIFILNCFATRFCRLVADMSQIPAPVATTSGKSPRNLCPPPKTAVPLRCDSEITIQLINSINIKIKDHDTAEFYGLTRSHNGRVSECNWWEKIVYSLQ